MTQSKFKNFPSISKDEWLSKIQKEYKDKKSLRQLYSTVGDFEFHPFHHPSDVNTKFSISPFPNNFITGIHYNNGMPTSLLINYLEAGVSLIYVDSDIKWSSDLESKIRWDFLQTIIVDNVVFYDKLTNHAAKNNLELENHLIVTSSQRKIDIDINEFVSGDSNIESLKEEIHDKNDFDVVVINLSDHFLFNIGFMRALVRFFQDRPKSPMILAVCTCVPEGQESTLISETTQMISARLSGIPNILLSSSSTRSIGYHKAMIPNILDFESHLKFTRDPISGSQFIDHLSHQIYNKLVSH